MILIFIIFFIALYAYLDAGEEVSWSHPFRYFNEEQYPLKFVEMAKAHKYGGWGISVLAVFAATINFIHEGETRFLGLAYSALEGGLCSLLSYSLVFDPTFALGIGEEWDYLGKEAKTDSFLNKVLGRNSGKIKAITCVTALLIILIFHFFIHKF